MFKKRTAIAISMLAGLLFAESQKTQALLMALNTNSKQMVSYRWKQKTSILRKGNPAGFKLDEVQVDPSGQVRRYTLAQPEAQKMGPLRARKAAEIKDDIQEVMQLAARYTNPQQLGLAIRKGEIWEGQGSMRIQARSLILPLDEMNMVVNSATFLPARVEFKSQYEGRPVMITADYQALANGPSMLTHMTVQIPGDDVVVHVESFDFVRAAGLSNTGF
ncbi:MAG: hypothetical protein QM757_18825 [Paludibaculum sp.]